VAPIKLYSSQIQHGLTLEIRNKDTEKLESVQLQCIRRLIGAKAYFFSLATEVTSGIIPVRFHKKELCFREYVRIITKHDEHYLRKMMASSTRAALWCCPLEYMCIMNKQLDTVISECELIKPEARVPDCSVIKDTDNITVLDLNVLSGSTNVSQQGVNDCMAQSTVVNRIMVSVL